MSTKVTMEALENAFTINDESSKGPRVSCAVLRLQHAMGPAEYDFAVTRIMDPRMSAEQVSTRLEAAGVSVSRYIIAAHRAGRCVACSRAAEHAKA